MFEDPNRGARQTSTQHQRRMIQLVAQDEATLQPQTEMQFLNESDKVYTFFHVTLAAHQVARTAEHHYFSRNVYSSELQELSLLILV